MPANENSSPKDRFDVLLLELHGMVDRLAHEHQQDIAALKAGSGCPDARSDRSVSANSPQTFPECPTSSGASDVQHIHELPKDSTPYGRMLLSQTQQKPDALLEGEFGEPPEFFQTPPESTPMPLEQTPRRFISRQIWVADQPIIEIRSSVQGFRSDFTVPRGMYLSSRRGLSKVVVRPFAPIRCLWHALSFLFLVFDIFVVPFEFAFDLSEFQSLALMQLVNFVGNCFWSVDIAFTFFTGKVTRNGDLVMGLRSIAASYIRSWFFFDLSISATDWVIFYTTRGGHSPISILRFMRFARLARIVHYFRTSWLHSLLRSFALKMQISSAFLQTLSTSAMPLVLGLILVHFAACAWHTMGDQFDDGWIRRLNLDSNSVEYRYSFAMLWSVNRMHGLFTASVIGSPLREVVLEGYLVLFSCVCMTALVTQLTTAMTSYEKLWTNRKMRRYADDYIWRNNLSKELQVRVSRFLNSSRLGGPQEIVEVESCFVQHLPEQLKHDTLYHAHRPALCHSQFFMHLYHGSPRALRHVCSEALSFSCAVKHETVFAEGDVCHFMFFLRSGSFQYSNMETGMKKPLYSLPTGWSPEEIEELEECHDSVDKPLCEHVLWTSWEHVGNLSALEDSMLITLSAITFGRVIVEYETAYYQARCYAKLYIRRLNALGLGLSISDVSSFRFTAEEFENVFFKGSKLDHFMFISHYKVEAGTEATLMRDHIESIIANDQRHPGNDLRAPVFVDSEDLEDLAELEEHVKRSRCLLLLLTPGLLSRPWCLLEIATAWRSGVHVVPVEVQRPGIKYQYPDDNFYAEFTSGKHVSDDGIKLLQSEGVELKEIVQALKMVFKKIALPFSPHKTRSVRHAEIKDILQRC